MQPRTIASRFEPPPLLPLAVPLVLVLVAAAAATDVGVPVIDGLDVGAAVMLELFDDELSLDELADVEEDDDVEEAVEELELVVVAAVVGARMDVTAV